VISVEEEWVNVPVIGMRRTSYPANYWDAVPTPVNPVNSSNPPTGNGSVKTNNKDSRKPKQSNEDNDPTQVNALLKYLNKEEIVKTEISVEDQREKVSTLTNPTNHPTVRKANQSYQRNKRE